MNAQLSRLHKCDLDGSLVWTVTIPLAQSSGMYCVDPINAVAIDPMDRLYVLHGNTVTRYDMEDGGVLSEWSRGNSSIMGAPGGDIATDPAGNLYVAAQYGGVDLVDPMGNTLASVPGLTFPSVRIATDSAGNLYAAAGPRLLTKFSPRHEQLSALSVDGDVLGIAAGPSGLVYVLGQHDVLRIDPATPAASLTINPTVVLTGQAVPFDASGSFAPLSTVTRYEWDLDGDGTFETDTGAVPRASRAYSERGEVRVSVRVTAESGVTDTAVSPLTIRLASAPGPVGVSVNGGAQFTNEPNVTLSIRWPAYATSLLISNDGGFTDAASFPVDAAIPWTLDSSGPERLPKTIYVRFQGGSSGPETYQDDIILDQTPPTIDSLRVAARGTGEARTYRLRVGASDELSGVAHMQITNDIDDPGELMPFQPKTEARSRGRKLFVRVQDLAGNFSPWRKRRR